MEEKENVKMTAKDWFNFIGFTIVLLAIGFLSGISVGRNHPSASALDKELTEIDAEVKNLKRAYDENREEWQLSIEVRDSIIYALKRELAKGNEAEIPVNVNFYIDKENGSK